MSLISEYGAGDGNRTHVISLEGWSSTIELHPQIYFNSRWWRGEDSNLRRQSRQIYSLIPLAAREPLLYRISCLLSFIERGLSNNYLINYLIGHLILGLVLAHLIRTHQVGFILQTDKKKSLPTGSPYRLPSSPWLASLIERVNSARCLSSTSHSISRRKYSSLFLVASARNSSSLISASNCI